MTLEDTIKQIQALQSRLDRLEKSDRFIYAKDIEMQDGRNVQVGRTTGTKIATANDQKLGFFGATPVIYQGIPAPFTAADIGTALIALGLLYRNN